MSEITITPVDNIQEHYRRGPESDIKRGFLVSNGKETYDIVEWDDGTVGIYRYRSTYTTRWKATDIHFKGGMLSAQLKAMRLLGVDT
jgi:hypothetical protein